MPRGGSGNSLTFGAIVLVSETEDMVSLVATLAKIIKEHGYPGVTKRDEPSKEIKEPSKEAKDEFHKEIDEFHKEFEKVKNQRDWTGGPVP